MQVIQCTRRVCAHKCWKPKRVQQPARNSKNAQIIVIGVDAVLRHGPFNDPNTTSSSLDAVRSTDQPMLVAENRCNIGDCSALTPYRRTDARPNANGGVAEFSDSLWRTYQITNNPQWCSIDDENEKQIAVSLDFNMRI